MKQKNKISLIVSFLAIPIMGFGQDFTPKITPQTPEISAFGKFLDTPVSLNSGQTNVSIDLVTLKGTEQDISLTLNYNSGGIRVSEFASRVGLGWVINTGGFISRAVKGQPDDSGHGFLNGMKVNNFLNLSTAEKSGLISGSDENDFESDVYSFNFLGISGKFYFDQNGNILTTPKSDILIEKVIVNSKIKGWIVTNTNGIKYYFGVSKDGIREANDTTQVASTTKSQAGWSILDFSVASINSWHLMDIEISNGKLFSYEYLSSSINFWNIGSQDIKLPSLANGSGGTPISTVYVNNQDITHRVTSITTDQGKIEFLYEQQRLDLKNDYCLTKINLKDKNNTIVDSYKFYYEYKESNATYDNPISFENSDQRKKRLMLKKVVQQINTTENKVYSFEYYDNLGFPERLSFSQDHWGYFNGKINTYYFPQITYPQNNTLVTSDGGNKKVDDVFSKALSLKKIIYPTKGYTTFEYESNTSSTIAPHTWIANFQDEVIKEINTQDLYGEKEEEIVFSNLNPYEQTFSLEVLFSNQCSNPNALDCPRVDLFKFVNGSYQIISSTTGEYKKETFILPETGELRLKIKLYNYSEDGFLGGRNEAYALIYKSKVQNPYRIPVGGLRIKQINSYNFDNSLISRKEYRYNFFNEPSKSSGLSQYTPVFLIEDYPLSQTSLCRFLKSDSVFPLYNGGNSVLYNEVTEIFNDGKIGKNEYTYSFTPDGAGLLDNFLWQNYTQNESYYQPITNEGLIYSLFYDTPKEDYSHRRGLLTKKKTYSYQISNNSYIPVEEENYEYGLAFRESNKIRTKNIFIKKGPIYFGYGAYNIFSENIKLDRIIKKSYFNGQAIENWTKNSYASDDYYSFKSPRQEERNNSLNETISTEYFYPYDVTSTSSLVQTLTVPEKEAIDLLKTKNIIDQPVQIITSRKNSSGGIISKTTNRTNFKNWGVYANTTIPSVKPVSIYTSKENLPFENRMIFTNYDEFGNARELQQEDGMYITYLWGYNKTQPIAKIENARYADVQQYEANLQTLSNGTDENALLLALNTLRSNFPNAMVTTYTHKPLIGVSTVTSPVGEKVTYIYDEFNRLKQVIDHNGNILNENQYNYRAQ